MKSYADLANENAKLIGVLNAIYHDLINWQDKRFRVVYGLNEIYVDGDGRRVMPFGMYMAIMSTNICLALDKTPPKANCGEEMYPVEFEPEER